MVFWILVGCHLELVSQASPVLICSVDLAITSALQDKAHHDHSHLDHAHNPAKQTVLRIA